MQRSAWMAHWPSLSAAEDHDRLRMKIRSAAAVQAHIFPADMSLSVLSDRYEFAAFVMFFAVAVYSSSFF